MQLFESLQSTTVCLLFVKLGLVSGHGRLMDPPARNAMWRFGFNTPVDYNDNELICGGPSLTQGKKCGICGDDINDLQGPHMAGGRFARGIIGRQYKVGQVIQVEVELTANHWGRFEMFVCPVNDPSKEATESCFQRYPLYLAEAKKVPFLLPKNYKKWGIFRYHVRLPPSLTCAQCVLQWTYYSGFAYGPCPDGNVNISCGGYATFRNCADIAILGGSQGGNFLKPKPVNGKNGLEIPTVVFFGENDSGDNTTLSSVSASRSTTSTTPTTIPTSTTVSPDVIQNYNNISITDFLNSLGFSETDEVSSTASPTTVTTTPSARPTTISTTTTSTAVASLPSNEIEQEESNFVYNVPPEELPTPVRLQVCVGTPLFRKLFGADEWCKQNCLKVPPKCPPKMCTCPDTCDATGTMKGVPGAETWCQGHCIVYPYKCHEESRCNCYKAVHEESVFTDYFPFTETKLGTW